MGHIGLKHTRSFGLDRFKFRVLLTRSSLLHGATEVFLWPRPHASIKYVRMRMIEGLGQLFVLALSFDIKALFVGQAFCGEGTQGWPPMLIMPF